MKCPICGNDNVRRVHKNGCVRFFSFMSPSIFYECISCGYQFHLSKKSFESGFIKINAILWLIIFLGFIVSTFLFQWLGSSKPSRQIPLTYTLSIPQDNTITKERISGSNATALNYRESVSNRQKYVQKEKEPLSNEAVLEVHNEPSIDPALIDFDWMSTFDLYKESVFLAKSRDLQPVEKQGENKEHKDSVHKPTDVPEAKTDLFGYSEKNFVQLKNHTASPAEKIISDQWILKSIEYQTSEDGFEVIINTNQTVGEYNSFFLHNPPRLVIDLKGSWNNEGRQIYEINAYWVKKIRTGMHPDKLRIVIDLPDIEWPSHVLKKSTRGLSLMINP